MATAIPVSDLKVFPTANDLDGGSEGSGNIVTEENLDALLSMLPPKNFVIDGLVISYVGDYQVSISSGSAFIEGRFVELQDTMVYTLDPLPSVSEQSFAYISLILDIDLSGQATGGHIYNTITTVTLSPGDPDDGVLLGVAVAAADGKLLGSAYTFPSKRSFAGGTFAGSYKGVSGGTVDTFDQKIELPFTPSFVYISGDITTQQSKVISCSALLPAGDRTVDALGGHSDVYIGRGSKYSMGFSVVPSEVVLLPNWYIQEATQAPLNGGGSTNNGGTSPNYWSNNATVQLRMDGIYKPGDQVVAWHHPVFSDVMPGMSPFDPSPSRPTMSSPDGGEIVTGLAYISYNSLVLVEPDLNVAAWIKTQQNLIIRIKNVSGSTIGEFTDDGTGLLTTCVARMPAIEGSRANVVMSQTASSADTNKPVICEGGFIVNDSFSGGINNSGMSLNADTNIYYYWAMSS